MARHRATIEERLSRLTVVDDEMSCWIFSGSLNQYGYPVMSYFKADGARSSTTAHRLSYMTRVGPIPPGQYVCHRCDVRTCINPQHLFLGTQADNISDMVRKKRHKFWGRSPAVDAGAAA